MSWAPSNCHIFGSADSVFHSLKFLKKLSQRLKAQNKHRLPLKFLVSRKRKSYEGKKKYAEREQEGEKKEEERREGQNWYTKSKWKQVHL